MGRFRKDKGEKLRNTTPATTPASIGAASASTGQLPQKRKASKTEGSFRDHVRALGGNDQDIELLKDVTDSMTIQGGGPEDVRSLSCLCDAYTNVT
jgi:hypothetical protein